MKRFFVTGATGFLGHHLVAQLRELGHEVHALCRSEAPELASLGVNVHRGDILDAESVKSAAEGCQAAFHCAGKVSRLEDDAELMYRVHVDGTKCTLDALAETSVKRVVVASTSGTIAVSSEAKVIATESDNAPMDALARWPYYRSKLFAEEAALERNRSDFHVLCVNPSLLLGPGDLRNSSTEDVQLFLDQKIPFVPAGGMAFVDARDAADAMVKAMEKGQGGERYLINAANMTVATFFGRLERISGVAAPTIRLPRTNVTLAGIGADLMGRAARWLNTKSPIDKVSAEMSQYFWYCDSGKAQDELGWQYRDPNDTLADTIDDLRSRGVVWPQ